MGRLVKIGILEAGLKNNICDVPGVKVGHFTVKEGTSNTGITAILPHSDDIFHNKVVASSYAFNGFGKSLGFIQVQELGTIETPILLTNTLAVGTVADGLVKYMINENSDIGLTTGTVNPVVLECNDGEINNIRSLVLKPSDVTTAINDAKDDFIQGSIGAGTGMICHGLKGGIGSSSRIITIDGVNYTLGVLVNSNFGSSRGRDLIFKGRFIGSEIFKNLSEEDDKGSIAVVVATDLPVDCRQLTRIIKRSAIGIGRTGSFVGHGSGDVFIGFSTVNTVKHYSEAITQVKVLHDSYINSAFRAVVEATEEAILNSLLYSDDAQGFKKEVRSINNYRHLFADLLVENDE